jgi:hypothetical protein
MGHLDPQGLDHLRLDQARLTPHSNQSIDTGAEITIDRPQVMWNVSH